MNLALSAQLQRRIQRFAIAGILVTGLLVAIATAFPIYRDARELAAASFTEDARAQARSVGQFIGRARDISLQVASRSGIRDKLEDYENWKIGLAEFVSFTTPRIRDAIDQNSNIAAFTLIDANAIPVLELGMQIPPALLQAANTPDPVICGPVNTNDRLVLVVSAPILSRDGNRLGTDVLAFELQALVPLLNADTGSQPQRRQLLFNSADGVLFEIGPSEQGGRILPAGLAEQAFLERAAGGMTGMTLLEQAGQRDRMIAYGPVPDLPGWSFALVTPATNFDTPVIARLVSPLLMIAFLVIAGAWVTARAIRPAAEKVLQQSRQLKELSANMALAASVFEGSPQAVLILDQTHQILEANEACFAITGFSLSELRGKTLCDALCVNGSGSTFCASMWREVDVQGNWEGEALLTRKDGRSFPAWHSVSAVRAAAGEPSHYIAMFSDISEKRLAEDRIRHLAHHDPLTGLPNRSLLGDRLEHALERARRGAGQLALLFIDLDRFKHVNDSLGHPVGDRLLQEVARRLNASVREQDTLARQGGDEFVVVIEDISGPEDAARVAVKLLSALDQVVTLDGHDIYIGGSIGISLFPNDGDGSTTLLRCADSAMYEAKGSGGNTYRFYTAEQTRISRERFELESGLRRALERNELSLHYQAQVSCKDGRLNGVEALLRWQHPERGLIPPDRFIPLAEEIGLIGQIGEWVLHTACAQAKRWAEAGYPLRMAVNLSGQQIARGTLVALVSSALERSGLPPSQLELELTEGHVLKRIEDCIAELHAVKTLGITLAVDDFGTGYSSLSYLKRLPLDRLKIDRSFVEGIPDDNDDTAIVTTIMAMAQNLGMSVIAEGVETQSQLDYLTAEHCAEYQGYLLAKPMPADELESWMKRYRAERSARSTA